MVGGGLKDQVAGAGEDGGGKKKERKKEREKERKKERKKEKEEKLIR
jgi:hypothetical protein